MPEQTREVFLHFSTAAQVAFYVLGTVAMVICGYGFWRKWKKYRRGRAENQARQGTVQVQGVGIARGRCGQLLPEHAAGRQPGHHLERL